MNKDVNISNMGCLGLAGPCRSSEILLEVSELTGGRMGLVPAAPALPAGFGRGRSEITIPISQRNTTG